MKSLLKIWVVIAMLSGLFACKKDALLDTESQTIFTDDQIWKDPKLINAVLANLYDRMPKYANLTVDF